MLDSFAAVSTDPLDVLKLYYTFRTFQLPYKQYGLPRDSDILSKCTSHTSRQESDEPAKNKMNSTPTNQALPEVVDLTSDESRVPEVVDLTSDDSPTSKNPRRNPISTESSEGVLIQIDDDIAVYSTGPTSGDMNQDYQSSDASRDTPVPATPVPATPSSITPTPAKKRTPSAIASSRDSTPPASKKPHVDHGTALLRHYLAQAQRQRQSIDHVPSTQGSAQRLADQLARLQRDGYAVESA